MNDERSYVALVCLACGKDKDDIRHQSEVLKERFVDYLISKVAAGICNLGNEVVDLITFFDFLIIVLCDNTCIDSV